MAKIFPAELGRALILSFSRTREKGPAVTGTRAKKSPLPQGGRGAGVRASVAVGAALACACATAVAVETVEPRSFGYTVGDVLERRIEVDPQRDGTVDASSLPHPGRHGRWFALRAVLSDPAGVVLRYQIVNSPDQPQLENLPSMSFRLHGADGRVRDADIGPFTVGMAPVALFGPYDSIQAGLMRPDRDPAPIATDARRRRLMVYGVALLALIALQFAPRLARPWLARRAAPFTRTWRALRRAARRGDDVDARRRALKRLHQALDESAGATVALDNLDRLLLAQPHLGAARASIASMLEASRAAFFGQDEPPPMGQLLALARQLADLETQAAR